VADTGYTCRLKAAAGQRQELAQTSGTCRLQIDGRHGMANVGDLN
jgi:hypothetical protein